MCCRSACALETGREVWVHGCVCLNHAVDSGSMYLARGCSQSELGANLAATRAGEVGTKPCPAAGWGGRIHSTMAGVALVGQWERRPHGGGNSSSRAGSSPETARKDVTSQAHVKVAIYKQVIAGVPTQLSPRQRRDCYLYPTTRSCAAHHSPPRAGTLLPPVSTLSRCQPGCARELAPSLGRGHCSWGNRHHQSHLCQGTARILAHPCDGACSTWAHSPVRGTHRLFELSNWMLADGKR